MGGENKDKDFFDILERQRYLKGCDEGEKGTGVLDIKNVKYFNIPNSGFYYWSIWIGNDQYRSPINGAINGPHKFAHPKMMEHRKKTFLKTVKIELNQERI